MRELLGGKGANVAEMTRVLGPHLVPAGFTITTAACVEYMRLERVDPDGLVEQVARALDRLERNAGLLLGDAGDPLLVSVRSGARESMQLAAPTAAPLARAPPALRQQYPTQRPFGVRESTHQPPLDAGPEQRDHAGSKRRATSQTRPLAQETSNMSIRPTSSWEPE